MCIITFFFSCLNCVYFFYFNFIWLNVFNTGGTGSLKLLLNLLHVLTFTTWDSFWRGGRLMHLRKLCRFLTLFSGSFLLPGS